MHVVHLFCSFEQIFFEGKFNPPSTPGSIALDDLHIYASQCSEISTTPSMLVSFDCGDGTTIPQSSVWLVIDVAVVELDTISNISIASIFF
jgi:hypothetical protein